MDLRITSDEYKYRLKKILDSNLHPDLKNLRIKELNKGIYYEKYLKEKQKGE